MMILLGSQVGPKQVGRGVESVVNSFCSRFTSLSAETA